MTRVGRPTDQLRTFIGDSDTKTYHKLGKQRIPAEGGDTQVVWSVAGSDQPGVYDRTSFCAPWRHKFSGLTSRGSVSFTGGFARGRWSSSSHKPSVSVVSPRSFAPLESRVAVSEVRV